MSMLARVVIVVFSRKCLTFQTQQEVIDILYSLKCGPKALLAISLSFPLTIHIYLMWSQGKENEPSVIERCNSGSPNTTSWSGIICNQPCHWPRRTKIKQTNWPLFVALFLTPYLSNAYLFTLQHPCHVTEKFLSEIKWCWILLRFVFLTLCMVRRRKAHSLHPVSVLSLLTHCFLRIYFAMTLHRG